MDLNTSKEDFSDDDIYFGKLSIKEIKKHIFMGRNRRTISCLPVEKEESPDKSFTLIETNSEPSVSVVMENDLPDIKTITGLPVEIDESHDKNFPLIDTNSVPSISGVVENDLPDIQTISGLPLEKCLPVEREESPDKSFTLIETNSEPSVSVVVENYLPDIKTITGLPVERDESPDKGFPLIDTNSVSSISGVVENDSPDFKSMSSPYFNHSRLKSTDSDGKSSDDSFIRLEKMVTELCISPRQDTDQVLDNTFDVVDYILNTVPKDDTNKYNTEEKNVRCSVTNADKADKENLVTIEEQKDFGEIKLDLHTAAYDDIIGINSEEKLIECKEPEIKQNDNNRTNKCELNDEQYLSPVMAIDNKPSVKEYIVNTQEFKDCSGIKHDLHIVANEDNTSIHSREKFMDCKEPDIKIINRNSTKNSELNNEHVLNPDMITENKQEGNENSVNIQKDKDSCEIKHNVCLVTNEDNTGLNSKGKIIHCRQPEIKIINSKTPNKMKLNNEYVFKTPKSLLSCKKQPTSIKKTPAKSSAYQHISSPIASYIKKSPQIPLLQAVHPKKPLPGISAIPKLSKSIENKINNKENIQLPSIAYKSAKKTKLVPHPDQEKLPQGPKVNKLITSLPKPVVIKHDHRQVITSKKPLDGNQEDSFADLTLHQAELSLCTQKSAFTK